MEKNKLVNWLKKRKQPDLEGSIVHHGKQEPEFKQMKEESMEKPKGPIKEYNETLYSKGSAQKQPTKTSPEKKQPMSRTSWENADIIEDNIDKMRRKHTESTDRCTQMREDTNKKVDFILLKKKR